MSAVGDPILATMLDRLDALRDGQDADRRERSDQHQALSARIEVLDRKATAALARGTELADALDEHLEDHGTAPRKAKARRDWKPRPTLWVASLATLLVHHAARVLAVVALAVTIAAPAWLPYVQQLTGIVP